MTPVYIPLLDVELVAVILGFATGIAMGNAGKNFDYEFQQSEWFQGKSKFHQYIVKIILNSTHHFQYGLILMLYALKYLEQGTIIFWVLYSLGFGLVVTDIKDIPQRFRKFFTLG